LSNKWTELIKIRDKCNSSIELKRASKEIGSSLEVNLKIFLNDKLIKLANEIDFSELCITSGAKIDKINKKDSEEIVIETTKAEGKKCPVCWKINTKPCERHFS
jgi:isoleucyl-tRNA synthetase